ncbi:MAG: hypothetical protein U0237_17860 [Thermoleophilia bacterium]
MTSTRPSRALRVSEAVDDLVAVVKRQQRDLARLQEQSEQLAKLRKLLS